MPRQTYKKSKNKKMKLRAKPATKKRKTKLKKEKEKEKRIEKSEENGNIAIQIHEMTDAPTDIETIQFDPVNRKISPELNKDTMIIGIVHASWCSHCTALMESESEHQKTKWQEMQDIIRSESKSDECPYKDIKTMAIEDENKEFIEEFDRQYRGKLFTEEFKPPSYPYIVKINGGNMEKYNDARDPRSMATWFLSKKPIV
jgi:hypothetical protein